LILHPLKYVPILVPDPEQINNITSNTIAY